MDRICWGWLALIPLWGMCVVSARGDDANPPAPMRPEPLSVLEGLQLNPEDEPLTPLDPVRPETPEMKASGDALTWYMMGLLHRSKGEDQQALEAFRKGIDRDPAAIGSYQGAFPLLLKLRKEDEARELALKAAQNTPEGFKLLQTLAAVHTQADNVDAATTLLEQALQLPNLKADSVQALLLHRDLGLYFRLGEQFDKAAEHYEAVMQALTGDKLEKADWEQVIREPGATYDEFGDTFLKAEKPQLALRAYEEASKYREAKPGLHSYNLATVFRQTGNPEQALEELEGYFNAQLQTRGRMAYQLLKDLLHDLKRDDELLSRLEKMHEDDPHNEGLTYFLADQYVATGRLDDAIKIYVGDREEVVAPRAVVGMLGVSRVQQKPAEMLKYLTKAFQTVPRADDAGVLANLADDVRDLAEQFEAQLTQLKADDAAMSSLLAYAREQAQGDEAKLEFIEAYLLGKLAVEAERTDDAIDFYRLAISMRNDPPSLLYTELGTHLIDAKKYDVAVKLLTEAVNHPATSVQRDRWRFQFFLSYALAYSGKEDEAVQVIQEAQKLQPDFARLFYQEAWIVAHARRWEEALTLFQKVIKQFPGEKELIQDCQFRISNIYVEMGDKEKGEQVLLDVLKDDPEHPQANNDLGYLWADQNKNLDRAKEMIEKALAAEPENPAYLDSMGWVLYRLGEYAKAIEYLKQATTHKYGEDSTIFDHLADCQVEAKLVDEARANYEQALKLEQEKESPDEELVEKIKAKLEKLKG
ncbi:MAG: tetratricopeptide repeat protein [Planctomycetaceae bacterium]|nr:tetratricopeptide repeat protein [Planctomycetaceae bacterium]